MPATRTSSASTLGDVVKPIDTSDALQQVWKSLQAQIPDLPDAQVAAANGARGSGCTTSWSEGRPPLLLVGAQTIEEGPEASLNHLLHQAAHALTPDGGLTSAAHGRWHNRTFRLAAEKLGLRVTGHANSITVLHEGQLRYDDELRLLRSIRQPTVSAGPKTRQTQVAATCACVPPKHIRAMPSTLARRTVICTDCGQPFTATVEA
jgi:hypothetical protein